MKNPLYLLGYLVVCCAQVCISQEKDVFALPPSADDSNGLITKSYTVPPTIFWGTEPIPKGQSGSLLKMRDAKSMLETGGLEFPDGAFAKYIPSLSQIIIRNSKENMEVADIYFDKDVSNFFRQVTVINEVIEVERNLYNEWIFENRLSEVGDKLRATAQDWVNNGKATIIDTTIATSQFNTRATSESIQLFHYPGCYKKSETAKIVNSDDTNADAPSQGLMAIGFEVKNLGTTIEADPTLLADGDTTEIIFHSERSKLNDYTIWPPEGNKPLLKSKMPKFHSNNTSTKATIKNGNYTLLATHRPLSPSDPARKNPILLNFARADVHTIDLDRIDQAQAKTSNPKTQTRSYQLPRGYISSLFIPIIEKPKKKDGKLDIEKSISAFGIKFEKGHSASLDETNNILTMTNTPKSFDLLETQLTEYCSKSESQINVHYEWIEMDHNKFSNWLWDNQLHNNGIDLRDQVQKWILNEQAVILDSATTIASNYQQTSVASGDEYIYPYEYDSDTPEALELFETMELGTTLEVTASWMIKSQIIALHLAPEMTKQIGFTKWSEHTPTHMPTFHIQRITNSIWTISNKYTFTGTTKPHKPHDTELTENPIVLHFVRADMAPTKKWSIINSK